MKQRTRPASASRKQDPRQPLLTLILLPTPPCSSLFTPRRRETAVGWVQPRLMDTPSSAQHVHLACPDIANGKKGSTKRALPLTNSTQYTMLHNRSLCSLLSSAFRFRFRPLPRSLLRIELRLGLLLPIIYLCPLLQSSYLMDILRSLGLKKEQPSLT